MSSTISDAEEQTNLVSACFQFISSKPDHEPPTCNSNPQSSFYCIKNAQQSSFPPSSASVIRPSSANSVFSVIPIIPQDTANNVKVRSQLIVGVLFFNEKELA